MAQIRVSAQLAALVSKPAVNFTIKLIDPCWHRRWHRRRVTKDVKQVLVAQYRVLGYYLVLVVGAQSIRHEVLKVGDIFQECSAETWFGKFQIMLMEG